MLLTLCGALAGLLPVASRAADESVPVVQNKETTQTPPATATTTTAEPKGDAKAAPLSAGLDDIVKLTKAKIDEPVILTFIKCSEVAYQPNAEELIKLRELGVSPMVAAALLQRGEEVRQAQKNPPQAGQPTQMQVASPPEPTPVY